MVSRRQAFGRRKNACRTTSMGEASFVVLLSRRVQGATANDVAIVGVVNCASALVQGLEFYKDAPPGEQVPGLMHVQLGPYHVRDVQVVAAFDVDGKKVGRDVAEALRAEPNNTIQFADVPPTGVIVRRGPTLDGLGQYYRDVITESDEEPVDVAAALRGAGA